MYGHLLINLKVIDFLRHFSKEKLCEKMNLQYILPSLLLEKQKENYLY